VSNPFYHLLEGGNVFKDPHNIPLTTRVERDNIASSLAQIEKILNIKLDDYLGSTGKSDSSGDIDVAVDSEKYDKIEIANKLKQWVSDAGKDPREWVKLSGSNVHFKLPVISVSGEPTDEFVQLDLMFGNPAFLVWSMKDEPGEYKGVHRQILMSGIAKAMGLKWSGLNGLSDREGNNQIKNPIEIIRTLLPGYANDPLEISVESIVEFIYAKYADSPEKIEQLLGSAAATLAEKHNVMLPMPSDEHVNESNDTDVYFLAKLRDNIINSGSSPLIEKDEYIDPAVYGRKKRL